MMEMKTNIGYQDNDGFGGAKNKVEYTIAIQKDTKHSHYYKKHMLTIFTKKKRKFYFSRRCSYLQIKKTKLLTEARGRTLMQRAEPSALVHLLYTARPFIGPRHRSL